jgi:hypothetical protein
MRLFGIEGSFWPCLLASIMTLVLVDLWRSWSPDNDRYGASVPTGNEVQITAQLARQYDATTEVRLPDGTRCDLVNEDYAIEVEWPVKWAESIGQSLYYASVLQKKPAVVYLVSDPPKDAPYIRRARVVCEKYKIAVYEERVSKRGAR